MEEYRGHWDTPEDFAQDLVEELGYMPKDFPNWIHIDWTVLPGLAWDYSLAESGV